MSPRENRFDIAVIVIILFTLLIWMKACRGANGAEDWFGWGNTKPVRTETRFTPIINDIESHIYDGPGIGKANTYRDSNKVTHAHEMTHGVNSRLRNEAVRRGGNAVQAVYCLNGRCFVFPRVVITLRHVASQCPAEWHDSTFQLYMRTQLKWWGDEPHYIFDEGVAYLNGTKVAMEIGDKNTTRFDLEQCARFYRYGTVFEKMANCGYVTQFQSWYLNELQDAIARAEQWGVPVGQARAMLASVGVERDDRRKVTKIDKPFIRAKEFGAGWNPPSSQ